MAKREADLSMSISVIKSEYREMPGLQLTKAQVRRMWGLGEADCDLVLNTLQADDFLRVTAHGCYILADSERSQAAQARSSYAIEATGGPIPMDE
jgi:hypothetical protein